MARVTVEDCLKRVDNRFRLVHLGAKRVIQLRKGAKPLVEAHKNKEIVLALREIAAGAVDFSSVTQIEQDQLSPKADQDALDSTQEGAGSQEAGDEVASETKPESDNSEAEKTDEVTPEETV